MTSARAGPCVPLPTERPCPTAAASDALLSSIAPSPDGEERGSRSRGRGRCPLRGEGGAGREGSGRGWRAAPRHPKGTPCLRASQGFRPLQAQSNGPGGQTPKPGGPRLLLWHRSSILEVDPRNSPALVVRDSDPTSVAELFALVWASARRGLEELAFAGVLGSAIYKATVTLGVAAIVRPLPGAGLQWQAWLAAGLPAALIGGTLASGRLGRTGGVMLVATYAAYLALTFAR